MGFIKKIIGNLLAFLGGLFGSFGKVLGLKKSGYFLELDESKDEPQPSAPANTVSTAASNGASPKPEPAKLEPVKVQSAQPATKTAQTSAVEQKAPDTSVPESKPTVPLNTPQPVPTFAPEFLMSTASQNGRRRPGPSMNYFLDMAKKVKA
jgi:hypothetical protein